jgi:hypothetical protein
LVTGNRERHHDPVADLQRLVVGADLNHLAHVLMAENVALVHCRDNPAINVQVRAANRTGRHLDDGVARMLDLWLRNFFAANIAFTEPRQGFHLVLPFFVIAPRRFRTLTPGF